MNSERLLKLASLLHDNSKGRVVHIPGDGTPNFSLRTWINEKRDCGTSACAVGCAMLSPEFQAEGLVIGQMEHMGNMQPVPQFGQDLNWLAVYAFFAIDTSDANFLFDTDEYPDEEGNPTPKQVARRIRKFVADHTA